MLKLRRRWAGEDQEKMMDYTNSQIEHLIDEYIHNRRNRKILKMHFIDGEPYEVIGSDAEINRTPRQVGYIIEKCSAELSRHL